MAMGKLAYKDLVSPACTTRAAKPLSQTSQREGTHELCARVPVLTNPQEATVSQFMVMIIPELSSWALAPFALCIQSPPCTRGLNTASPALAWMEQFPEHF